MVSRDALSVHPSGSTYAQVTSERDIHRIRVRSTWPSSRIFTPTPNKEVPEDPLMEFKEQVRLFREDECIIPFPLTILN